MAPKVFTSFHYKADVMRVAQVKQMGALAGQPLLTTNQWESVKGQGEEAIKRYIAREMSDKECLVVLIGSRTAGRRWVTYEINKAWSDGLGVLGVHIHNIRDPNTGTCAKGSSPIANTPIGSGKRMSNVVPVWDPVGANIYTTIETYIEGHIRSAIEIRNRF